KPHAFPRIRIRRGRRVLAAQLKAENGRRRGAIVPWREAAVALYRLRGVGCGFCRYGRTRLRKVARLLLAASLPLAFVAVFIALLNLAPDFARRELHRMD